MKDKVILDVCCGSRMFWFDKNNEHTIYNDIRKEEHILCDGRKLNINPDTRYDFTNLPFKDNEFKMVIFDPPHLLKVGEKSWLAMKYGKLDKSWPQLIKMVLRSL